MSPGRWLGERHETLGQYVAKTYLWMFAGLLVTFGIALAGYVTGAILYVFQVPYATLALTGLELLTVIWLSARIHKLSVGAARRAVSILCSFKRRCFLDVFPDLRCCGDGVCICGDRAVLRNDGGRQPDLQAGLERNPSIARWRTAVSDSLWSAFNVLNLGSFETVLCYAGIVVFLGFTAYDTTKIRDNYQIFSADPELLQKASVFSALQLYLDFINLFLYIIRLMNRNRK